jgi:hypothetical protein
MTKRVSKKSYVCGVDWQHEIEECNDVKLYSSVKALKKARSCWEECGIVELDIRVKKWIYPQNLSRNRNRNKKEK